MFHQDELIATVTAESVTAQILAAFPRTGRAFADVAEVLAGPVSKANVKNARVLMRPEATLCELEDALLVIGGVDLTTDAYKEFAQVFLLAKRRWALLGFDPEDFGLCWVSDTPRWSFIRRFMTPVETELLLPWRSELLDTMTSAQRQALRSYMAYHAKMRPKEYGRCYERLWSRCGALAHLIDEAPDNDRRS